MMKKSIGIVAGIIILASCGTIERSVSFENKRTPLNPIAHRGVTNYQVEAELMYAIEVEQRLQQYERDVAQAQANHRTAMEEYNSKTAAERILMGIQKPELILPERPFVPFLYNEKELASRISIEGMEKGDIDPLKIRLEYLGFEEEMPKKNQTTKKRKKDDVEYIDTLYHYTVRVKHPMIVRATAPNGENFNVTLSGANSWKTVKGKSFTDSAQAFNSAIDALEEEERKIALTNTAEANRVLNSEFGTSNVRYTVRLHSFKSSGKNDYYDLDQAVNTAQYGLEILNTKRNEAIENLNAAFVIWTNAANEYSNGKGRIKDKVMIGILKNLIVVSTFTENWEAGHRFIIQLENMKLKSKDRRELNGLKTRFNDLRARYQALKAS